MAEVSIFYDKYFYVWKNIIRFCAVLQNNTSHKPHHIHHNSYSYARMQITYFL